MTKNFFKYLFFLSFLLLLPSGAVARGHENSSDLFVHHDTLIPEGQTVENVVVVGGDAKIYGSVWDTVVVINGDLEIKKSAQISGLILVIGGKIIQEPGAQLRESVLNITFDEAVLNSLIIGGGLLAVAWILKFIFSLLLIVLPIITSLIARQRIEPYKLLVRQSPWRLLIIGAAASIFIIALGVLLSVTIVGIPIAFVLLLVTILFFLLGITAICMVAGDQLPLGAGRSPWMTAAGGSIAITAGVNLPFFGSLLLIGLFWLALGTVIMRLWEIRADKKSK